MASNNNQPTRISYTRAELLVLNPGKIRIPRQLFGILQELKICNAKRTRRGCRGGRHIKHRKTDCVESSGAVNPFGDSQESFTPSCETACIDVKNMNGATSFYGEISTQPIEIAGNNVKTVNGATNPFEEGSDSVTHPCETAYAGAKIQNGAVSPYKENTAEQWEKSDGTNVINLNGSTTPYEETTTTSTDIDIKFLNGASSTVSTVTSIKNSPPKSMIRIVRELNLMMLKWMLQILCLILIRALNLVVKEATTLTVCEIDEVVVEKLKKFRMRKEKNNAAIVLKIDPDALRVIEDDAFDEEDLQDMDPDTLGMELPAHSPRYVAYSYCLNHDDGRISYPLCFIYSSPEGCKTELQMMYAGSKLSVVNVGGFTKTFEVRNPEEITEEWLKAKLSFFR